jgi:hypothetical protein
MSLPSEITHEWLSQHSPIYLNDEELEAVLTAIEGTELASTREAQDFYDDWDMRMQVAEVGGPHPYSPDPHGGASLHGPTPAPSIEGVADPDKYVWDTGSFELMQNPGERVEMPDELRKKLLSIDEAAFKAARKHLGGN